MKDLNARDNASVAELDNELSLKINDYHKKGFLIILMTAGPADLWLRRELKI